MGKPLCAGRDIAATPCWCRATAANQSRNTQTDSADVLSSISAESAGLASPVSETNGSWRKAIEVPGLGALHKGGLAALLSVSCRSAGRCAAGGFYTDGSGHGQAFVVSQAQAL
jgi:hypothetical protein